MNAPQTLSPVATAAVHAIDGGAELGRLLQGEYSPRFLLESDNLDKAFALASQMAEAKLTIPKHLVGNVGDCVAIVTQAMLWNMNPFAVAQKTHIVNGTLGYEAQLVNAVVQNSGAVRGAPHYEYRGEGDKLDCRVGFVLRGQTEVTFGEWLNVNAPTTKNSPLWKTNPKQQLGYLQLKNWARAFCPGAILGVYTVDELEDSLPQQSTSARRADPATGEIPPPPAAPPVWPAESFATQLPRWAKAVEAGLKSAADIEALAQSKGALTAEQLAAIRALKPAAADPATDPFVTDMEAAEGTAQ